MSEHKHTPAPWYVDGDGDICEANNRWLVALTAEDIFDRPEEETNANARLIAASPEMLPFVEMVAAISINDRWPLDLPVLAHITVGDVLHARELLEKMYK